MTTHRNHHLDRILGPLYRPGDRRLALSGLRAPLIKNRVEVWASRDVITEAELRGGQTARAGNRDISARQFDLDYQV